MDNELQMQIDEFDMLMQAALDEIATGDNDIAEDYFSDAAYILNQIQDLKIKKELETKYLINPLDFAK